MATKKAEQSSATVADPVVFPEGQMFPGLLEAAENVGAFQRMLEGVMQLSAAAGDITKWDQTRRELEARVGQLREMAQAAIGAREDAEKQAAEIRATVAENVAKADADMETVRQAARDEAAEIARKAKEAAVDYAAEQKDKTDKKAAKAADALAKVNEDIELRTQELAGLDVSVGERKAELDRLGEAIADLRQKLGAL